MHPETLRKLVKAAVPYLLPLPVFAGFALRDLPWLGYLIGLATLGYLWWRHRLDGLGRDRLVRSLLVAVAFAAAPHSGFGPRAVLAAAGLLLIGLINCEPLLVKALATKRMETANLEVVRPPAARMFEPRWPYLAHTVLLVGFGVVAGFGLPGWPLLPALAAAIGLGLWTLGYAWRQRRSAHDHKRDEAVWQALLHHQPRFAIHFSAPAGTEYHAGMWLPYLERIGVPYVIILREKRCLSVMTALSDAPIVVAPSMGHLEHVIPPSMTACFYVNNGMKNVQMVRFAELTHIQLLHGDSDKASSYNPVTAMFDKIFVAGRAGIDRYADHDVLIPEQKFAIVGRPQVSEVEINRRPIADVEGPTVLYAPTWAGWFNAMNYCSLRIGERIVRGLLERGATVICRPHPYTTRNPAAARQLAAVEQLLAADAAATGRAHRYGEVTSQRMSLAECMNAADAMVSDVTAVASDWLYSEKPFAIIDMQDEGEQFGRTFPLSRAAYVVDSAAANLPAVLDQLLRTDPLAEVRRDMKTYYLGDFPAEAYGDAFVAEARRCVLGEVASIPELEPTAACGVLAGSRRVPYDPSQ